MRSARKTLLQRDSRFEIRENRGGDGGEKLHGDATWKWNKEKKINKKKIKNTDTDPTSEPFMARGGGVDFANLESRNHF